MLSGVPNFALADRLHQRLLDAQGRPGQPVRLPAAAPPRRHRQHDRHPGRRRPPASWRRCIDLKSGYVRRGVDRCPSRARRRPWRLHQNYPRDVLLMRHGRSPTPASGSPAPAPDRRLPADPTLRGRARPPTPPSPDREEHPMRDFVFPAAPRWSPAPPAASARRWRTPWPGAAPTWSCSTGTPNGWPRWRRDPRRPPRPADRHPRGRPRRRATRPTRWPAEIRRGAPADPAAGQQRRRRPGRPVRPGHAGGVRVGHRRQLPGRGPADPHAAAGARAEPGAHLVNVSSLFGLIAPAGQAAYSASKFAVRGFTEALRHELAGDGVGVTSVHPGGIRTRIAQSRPGSAAASPGRSTRPAANSSRSCCRSPRHGPPR